MASGVDYAHLGFDVDSSEAEVASRRLDELGKAANEAESAASRLQREMDKVGKSMQKMGRKMSMYVTAPLLAIGGAAAKMSAEFDSTLAKMATLVGVAGSEVAGFREEILKISPALGQGPAKLADALFAVTSAGQRGKQAIDTLTNAAKASAIGLGDTREVALAATAAVQAYGEANVDSTKAIEVLVGTIEQGNVAAEELAPVLGRVIPIAAELGVAFEDAGAFIAVFTRLGVKADEAVTSLRGVLATIQKPTEEAVEVLGNMGYTIEGLRLAIKEKGFIVTFQELITKAKQGGHDLAAIIPNVRALGGALGVFGGEGKLAEEVLEGVAGAVGTLQDRFDEMAKLDPTFQYKMMRAELQVLMVQIGDEMLPVLLELAQTIRSVIQAFQALSPETKTFMLRAGLLAAAIGPLLLILGSMVRTMAVLLPLFVRLGIVIYTRVIPAMVAFAASMGGTFGIVMLINAATVALGALMFAMRDTKRETTELDIEVQALIDSVEQLGKTQFETAIGKVNMAIAENDALIARLRDNLDTLIALQQQPMGAEASDRTARQIVQLAEQIAAAEAEGDHLRGQLERLGAAQEQFAYKTALANGELEEIIVTAQRMDDIDLTTPSLTETEAETLAKLRDELDPTTAAMKKLVAMRKLLAKAFATGDLNATEFEKLRRALERSALAMDAYADKIGVFKEMDAAIASELEASIKYVEHLDELGQAVDGLERYLDPVTAGLKDMAAAKELLNEALAEGVIDEAVFERLMEGVRRTEAEIRNMDDTFGQALGDWQMALQDVANSMDDGSQGAQQLQAVLQILNVVMGINAVIKQLSEGDVYSAIPRAVAVAAMIASMGVATNASGAAAGARSLQEAQGTGTVLGDAEAKSESIANATEITANATSELVGINRGMLHALQQMQGGIDDASEYLARGAAGADISLAGLGQNTFGDITQFLLDPLGIFGSVFGGSAKVKDQGIRIIGGSINQLINDILVQAFVKVREKKHAFDDSDIRWRYQDLDDSVQAQFSLIFQGMADTVFEAAVALGMDAEEIRAKIESFQIGDILISLKDLDGEEAQEEIAAVFGQIFDDLALSVIPFIGQFQQLGEGLGETLVRVATSVQVFQEAVLALGLSVDYGDPEALALMATGLVDLTGGVEEFISKFSTFFDRFASTEQKLAFATSSVTRAFESVGLTVPATRDGMIDLMMSLDASTEAGRQQIAMLLDIADAADEYYSLVENAEEERLQQAQEIANWLQAQRDAFTGFVGLGRPDQLVALEQAFDDAMKAAKALNATQKEYAMITRSFNAQLRRMAAQLTLDVLSMAQALFGQDNDLTGGIEEGFTEVREVANSVFEEWMRALESIYEFTQDILLDEQLTTLTPAEQLAEAQRQFDRLFAAAQAGDVEAAAALPDAARALLEEARFMYASGAEYTKIFDRVLAALDSISMPGGISPTIIEDDSAANDPGWQQEADYTASALAQELERYLAAADLAQALRDLSQVLNVSVIGLAAELGIPLNELVTILGVNLESLSESTAEAIGSVADMLGADVFELLDAIGVSLTDLAAAYGINIDELSDALAGQLGAFSAALGANVLDIADALGIKIEDLARTFGIGVDQFSAEQFRALNDFASTLGTSIGDVTERLGIDLGRITDATSLLSEALTLEIDRLPESIQADLGPLLDNIWMATTEADANDAIQDVGDYILGLPEEFRDQLTPFLELMGYDQLLPDLQFLSKIDDNTFDALGLLNDILQALGGQATVDAANAANDVADDAKVVEDWDDTIVAPGDSVIVDEVVNLDPVIDPIINDPVIDPIVNDPVFDPIVDDPILDPIDRDPIDDMRRFDQYADGGLVDKTGPAMLHAGEFVVTRSANNLSVQPESENLSAQELAQIRAVLVDIREGNRRYQEASLAAEREIEAGVKDQAEQTRRLVNG